MQGSKYSTFISLLYLPFFLWSFLGAHKQYIFDINTDHISIAIAVLASCLSVFLIRKLDKLELLMMAVMFAMAVVFGIASIFSMEFEKSIARYSDHLIYIFIAICGSIFFGRHPEKFWFNVIFSIVFSAGVVICSWLFLGLSSWGRMTVPVYDFQLERFLYFPNGYESSADPNVLAYFIFMGLLLFFYKIDKPVRHVFSILIFFAGFLTFSRSALVAFIFSCCCLVFLYALDFSSKNNKLKLSSIFKLLGVLSGGGVIIAGFVFYFMDNLLARIGDSFSNTDRISRLSEFTGQMLTSFPDFLIGRGVGASEFYRDPHLFYLSTVNDTGFLGLFLVLVALFFSLFFSIKLKASTKLVCLILGILILFMSVAMFYWQIRTFYFTLMVMYALIFQHQKSHREKYTYF